MPKDPRRVVTVHDIGGKSVFASDGPVPAAAMTPGGTLFYQLWETDTTPAPVRADAPEPAADPLSVTPPQHGTRIIINEMPPGGSSPMHRTQTIDYGIVLDGEVVLVLDDSETVLRAGDVVVQQGTNHRWENRSAGPAQVAFILIDGAFTQQLREALGTDGLGTVLGDLRQQPEGQAGGSDS